MLAKPNSNARNAIYSLKCLSKCLPAIFIDLLQLERAIDSARMSLLQCKRAIECTMHHRTVEVGRVVGREREIKP